jgi:16S rRNA U516 pseudouridylate synthase RsuA-like enzyme
VRVNGRLIQTPDHWVDIGRDKVTLDGKPVLSQQRVYLLLYKPKGYITTYKDPEGRPTVYDLLSGLNEYVFPWAAWTRTPAGCCSSPMTRNSPERLTNPAYKVAKTYLVKSATRLSDEQLDQLRRGGHAQGRSHAAR